MKISILTLFPEMFNNFLSQSIIGIAIAKKKISVKLIDIRDFSSDKHKQVDDYQYGGGAGMVMKPEPISAAIESVKKTKSKIPVIYFTPQGVPLTQSMIRKFVSEKHLILLCGHYKEVDQRVRDIYVTHEISVGDYILTGGEIPAMILTDAITRLIDGVLNDPDSALTDSHENGLLGYPCYTRPYDFKGFTIPDVLNSGHHQNILDWRNEKSLEMTLKNRPELIKNATPIKKKKSVYIGIVHHPVLNKAGETITSGITNLDVHDCSRSALTYGIKKFFLIHPNERQKEIFEHILDFWKTELATHFNKHRVVALKVINFTNTINDTVNLIKNQEGDDPIIITTTANSADGQKNFSAIRKLIDCSKKPFLILFGTGNGLHESVHHSADYTLEPIKGKGKYNHLSVRSAVAIVLDRLLSDEYKEE